MVSLIILLVKCYYSTSIGELTSFVRKILQREENKGVELTVYGARASYGGLKVFVNNPCMNASFGTTS